MTETVNHSLPQSPLAVRLDEYASRYGLRFAENRKRYELLWRSGSNTHFIEIDKATSAVRSGRLERRPRANIVYDSPPAYLEMSPLEELLDRCRRFADYADHLR
jgi:hypothetical protein